MTAIKHEFPRLKTFLALFCSFLMLFVVFPKIVYGINTINEGWKAIKYSSTLINVWSNGRNIINNSSQDVFVPTKTSSEWTSFINNKPLSITANPISTCKVSGGTVTDINGYRVHTFNNSGTLTSTSNCNVEVLVVAGGGGGGQYSGGYQCGGGGGGGGVLYNASLNITSTAYSVTVGAGGAPTGNGQNSSFSSLTAVGGGRGGYSTSEPSCSGATGGSGGGGAVAGWNGSASPPCGAGSGTQGGSGGTSWNVFHCGGGGGMSGNGGTGGGGAAYSIYGGPGGNGVQYDISGSSTYYGGGGGGGAYGPGGTAGLGGGGTGGGYEPGYSGAPSIGATSGAANRGGGGGGGTQGSYPAGGSGGSGVVIVRYTYDPNQEETKYSSCKQILDSGASAGNGLYSIDPDGNGPLASFQTYCDMVNGGWTLVLLNSVYSTNPTPTWTQAVNSNTITGTQSTNLNGDYDQLVGLGYWNLIGTGMRVEVGSSASSISHQAYYNYSLNSSNYYSLSLSSEQISIGGTVPGLRAYHADNGYSFTTHDADHDPYGSNCSNSYGNSPWWYGACWDGNFWGGGTSGGYANRPYWTGSGSDYYDWGAIWVGPAVVAVPAGSIIGGAHTNTQCILSGGTLDSAGGTLGTDVYLCKFSGSDVSCPSGWTQHNTWQKYSTPPGSCDACSRHCPYGPTTWSDAEQRRDSLDNTSGFYCYNVGCYDGNQGWWGYWYNGTTSCCIKGSGGDWSYNATIVLNEATNRTQVGCK